jgi:hypothetical protein
MPDQITRRMALTVAGKIAAVILRRHLWAIWRDAAGRPLGCVVWKHSRIPPAATFHARHRCGTLLPTTPAPDLQRHPQAATEPPF